MPANLASPVAVAAAAAVLIAFGPPAQADDIVVTSKPIHALVAAELIDIASPRLLVSGSASPHTYAMKPSDGEALANAKVLFRVAAALEPFTIKMAASLPAGVKVVSLAEVPGIKLLPARGAGLFADDHDHEAAHDHEHGAATVNGVAIDPHVWLDPANARAMAVAIHDILRGIYHASSDRLDANHARLLLELGAIDAAIQAKFAPVAAERYLVLHDAYQYLEVRYGLAGVGALSATPEPQAGPRRLASLRKAVQGLNVTCMFAEPGIDTRALAAVTEGSRVRTAVLDPEGTRLDPGPELYSHLMRDLASAMAGCLGAT